MNRWNPWSKACTNISISKIRISVLEFSRFKSKKKGSDSRFQFEKDCTIIWVHYSFKFILWSIHPTPYSDKYWSFPKENLKNVLLPMAYFHILSVWKWKCPITYSYFHISIFPSLLYKKVQMAYLTNWIIIKLVFLQYLINCLGAYSITNFRGMISNHH